MNISIVIYVLTYRPLLLFDSNTYFLEGYEMYFLQTIDRIHLIYIKILGINFDFNISFQIQENA